MPHLNNSTILFLGFCGDTFFEVTPKTVKNPLKTLVNVYLVKVKLYVICCRYNMVTIALNFKLVKEANLIYSSLAFGYFRKDL